MMDGKVSVAITGNHTPDLLDRYIFGLMWKLCL
jgi:hypothetical protein